MAKSKLGRPTDQRNAMLRNLTTAFLWNGKIVTTKMRAKQVQSIAEKLITLAINEYQNTQTVTKQTKNEKEQLVDVETVNDLPSKLHARRQIMSVLYNITLPKEQDETKREYKERASQANHPVVEKLFREIAPKYDKRAQDKGTKGGYTRIIKMGPRRGDSAEMVVLELV